MKRIAARIKRSANEQISNKSEAKSRYSEDMQHGADIDGVKIINPFKT